jgi:hypothetical protein
MRFADPEGTQVEHADQRLVPQPEVVPVDAVAPARGRRPDFFGVFEKDPSKRIVGDAKYVRELTPQRVKQVRQYKGYPFFAQKEVILVKKSTRVPDEVREMARNSDIKIVWMQARREKKKSLLERPFGF